MKKVTDKKTELSKIEKAINFCQRAHRGQFRKGSQHEYFFHPTAVAHIIGAYGIEDESLKIAALLHDVVEDTGYENWDIQDKFGRKIADIVAEVSEEKIDANGEEIPWKDRKNAVLKNLSETGSKEALTIKVADHIDNLRSTIAQSSAGTAKDGFNSSLKERIWYSKSIYKIAKNKAVHPGLLEELAICIQRVENKFLKNTPQ